VLLWGFSFQILPFLMNKEKIAGFFYLLISGYFGWIAYDCFQHKTLASNQINAMTGLAIWMLLLGLYYLLKRK